MGTGFSILDGPQVLQKTKQNKNPQNAKLPDPFRIWLGLLWIYASIWGRNDILILLTFWFMIVVCVSIYLGLYITQWNFMVFSARFWISFVRFIFRYLSAIHLAGLPRWLSGRESACQCRRHGFSPWVERIPWRKKWQPTPVFLPGKSHGQRSLGSIVHGVTKESDMT